MSAAAAAEVVVRRARTADVPRIRELVDLYSGERILLSKATVTLYEDVQEFWVAESGSAIVGCGALHVLWDDLAEVRTLATDPDRQVALARDFSKQHDGLIGGHLDSNADHVNFSHQFSLPAATQRLPRPTLTRVACRRTESAAISETASSARASAEASRLLRIGVTTCSTRPTWS